MSRLPNQTGLPTDQQETVSEPPRGQSPYKQPVKRAQAAAPPRIVDTPQHTFRSFTIQVEGDLKSILGESILRRYLLIQSTGGAPVFLGFGVNASVGAGIELPNGSQLDFSNGIVPNNNITAISSGIGTLRIIEGNLLA